MQITHRWGPLVPLNKLIDEDFNMDDFYKKEEDDKDDENNDHNLPNLVALLLVTNMKKDPSWKKSLFMVCHILWLINISYSSILNSFYSNML